MYRAVFGFALFGTMAIVGTSRADVPISPLGLHQVQYHEDECDRHCQEHRQEERVEAERREEWHRHHPNEDYRRENYRPDYPPPPPGRPYQER